MDSSRVYTVEGIVLKRKSVGEADRILTVFTKQKGKITVLAKGIRRITSRRSGHVEVFSHVVLTLHAGTIDIVTEAQAIAPGSRFEGDAQRMAYAYCVCELVDQLLADTQEHEDIFFFLVNTLEQITRQEASQQAMSEFIHRLLWALGFLPHAKKIPQESMRSYVEHITERKLRTWPLLTALA